ncbi:hypothetical protein GCN74_01895 [Janthinobacterium sp. FT14W]|uniref:hypothetical protein n=1 Tax=Janthinobacterium sp. FT14W TaxID=2654253 RepID=UPI00126419ED|nr:hypothetical protein [Janthinobacterium sp. FT14W]KAB8062562.1 hypothetical protein GCN74_01895 [Janthinobacterium sp. FT14W]
MSEAFSPAPCETGIFSQGQTDFVALTQGGKGYSYTFSDGTVGNTQDAGALLACGKDAVLVRGKERWPKVALAESDTRFASDGVMLAGRLMEAPGAGKDTPLVVYAHGSESSGWIGRARDPYQMVGRGVSVFVYDKRGTGLSEGEYTQNFPRLTDDLVAASREARRLAQGRYGRFGLIGGKPGRLDRATGAGARQGGLSRHRLWPGGRYRGTGCGAGRQGIAGPRLWRRGPRQGPDDDGYHGKTRQVRLQGWPG